MLPLGDALREGDSVDMMEREGLLLLERTPVGDNGALREKGGVKLTRALREVLMDTVEVLEALGEVEMEGVEEGLGVLVGDVEGEGGEDPLLGGDGLKRGEREVDGDEPTVLESKGDLDTEGEGVMLVENVPRGAPGVSEGEEEELRETEVLPVPPAAPHEEREGGALKVKTEEPVSGRGDDDGDREGLLVLLRLARVETEFHEEEDGELELVPSSDPVAKGELLPDMLADEVGDGVTPGEELTFGDRVEDGEIRGEDEVLRERGGERDTEEQGVAEGLAASCGLRVVFELTVPNT